MTSVCLGYVYGSIHPAFLQSVVELAGRPDNPIRAVTSVGGLYVDQNRNDLVKQFLKTDCEWLWSLDTDIEFPSDSLGQLLEATNDGERKIVAAAYWNIHNDLGTITTWLRMGSGHMHPILTVAGEGVMQIGACGMGCTLIHRRVLEDVAHQRRDNPDPWVWFGRDLVSAHGEHQRAGEDVTFCLRALRAGYATWGLCDLVVKHYKSQEVAIPNIVAP